MAFMYSRTKQIWTAVEAASAVVALILFLAYIGLWEQYAHTRPTMADSSLGRIYSLNEHGLVVYLNSSEQHRLHILIWTAGLSFLIAILVGVFKKKTSFRDKP